MDTLAKAYGGSRPEPTAVQQSNTTLLEVALHNAVEGCVHEAWAACVAMHQSIYADESLQRIFAQIANDEIKHAQLSWDLHNWFCSQLSEEEQEHIELAQLEAIRNLQTQANTPSPHANILGLSTGTQEENLRRRFTEQLAA